MGTFFEVRSAYRDEWDDAMALAWKTFLRFEADVYTPEGVRSFEDFITDTTALEEKKIIGMITLRNKTHISLLFVDEKYHRRGVGRALMEYLENYLLTEVGADRVTVNSSPYGEGFYHRLGFRDLRPQEQKNGIIYTPTEFIL